MEKNNVLRQFQSPGFVPCRAVTAEQYYADKGIDINSENFNSADNGSGSTDDSSDDGSDDDSGSYDDSSYDDGSYDDSYDESEE